MVTERWYEQDINKPIQVQHCEGVVFTADNLGNKIGVKLFNNGSAYSPGGTASCNIIRSDGITVNVNGTITGNSLSVTLPIDALTVPGRIAVVIQNVSGSVVTTVFKGIYTVELSSTSTIVAPSVAVSSLAELTANKVSKVGDTMTGRLYMRFSNGYPAISFLRPNGNNGVLAQATATNDSTSHMSFYQYSTDGLHFENYALPNTPVDLSDDAVYNILTTRAIQQGNASVSVSANSYADKTINFSPAFLTIPTVQLTINATTGGVGTALALCAFVNSVSKTQLVIRAYNGNSSDLGFGVMWTAIAT